MPPATTAHAATRLPSDDFRFVFPPAVSEAATHVPLDSFQTALKILFIKKDA
jgi:hypothetical protein